MRGLACAHSLLLAGCYQTALVVDPKFAPCYCPDSRYSSPSTPKYPKKPEPLNPTSPGLAGRAYNIVSGLSGSEHVSAVIVLLKDAASSVNMYIRVSGSRHPPGLDPRPQVGGAAKGPDREDSGTPGVEKDPVMLGRTSVPVRHTARTGHPEQEHACVRWRERESAARDAAPGRGADRCQHSVCHTTPRHAHAGAHTRTHTQRLDPKQCSPNNTTYQSCSPQ